MNHSIHCGQTYNKIYVHAEIVKEMILKRPLTLTQQDDLHKGLLGIRISCGALGL